MRTFLIHWDPFLTEKQFERFSNIFDNAGQVILGVVVLSPLIAGFDNINKIVLGLGIISVVFCWIGSIWFAKKGD